MTRLFLFSGVCVWSLPVTRETLVHVNCAEASGDLNCDWKCFDHCLYNKPEFINGEQFKECISNFDEHCLVPATTHTSMEVNDFCYRDEKAMEGHSYNAPIPTVDNDLWLRLQHETPTAVSLDVISAEFNSTACLATLVKYQVGSTEGVSSSSDCEESTDYPISDARFAFGFSEVTVNITAWALREFNDGRGLGESDQTVHLLTKDPCAGKPTAMKFYYSSDVIIDSANYDAAATKLAPFLLLLTALLLALN